MAISNAPNWGNLPNGNFISEIFSMQAQTAFRKNSVVQAITNTNYYDEISQRGDTVHILKEPEIIITDHKVGDLVEPQDLDDEEFTLIIDKARRFAFQMDDIQKQFSHIDYMEMAADRAAYKMTDAHDMEVLGYMCGFKQSDINLRADTVNDTASGVKAVATAGTDELLSTMKLKKGDFGNITTAAAADHSIPVQPLLPGATDVDTATVSPLQIVNRMRTKLDRQYVPTQGRFLVIDPTFRELLMHESSILHNADFGENGALRSGADPVQLYGFRVYVSNNLPEVGGGPDTTGTANQNTDYGVLLAGHESAVASAEQLSTVEALRSERRFVDIVRGMHLFGRKILRPESLVTAKYNRAY